MKVLTLDIETAPNSAYVWGLWQQNVTLAQLQQSGEVLCFAAKWEHKRNVMFHSKRDGVGAMREAAWELLNEADVVVHYNGTRFDIPWLQTEFARSHMTPPSPFVQVDLCQVAKTKFRFPSNKLEYVAGELLGDHKASTGGFKTWIGCMADDPTAWRLMEKYNRQDVLLTEALYERLKPWCKLANVGLYDGDGETLQCPQCGSESLQRRGLKYTSLSAYVQYYCNDCGRWSRGKSRVRGVDVR